MIMIRLLLLVHNNCRHSVHTLVFFVFFVSNIGSLLTSPGDPTLFFGIWNRAKFVWRLTWMLLPMLLVLLGLLAMFNVLDSYIYRQEGKKSFDPTPGSPNFVTGISNFVLLVLLIEAALISGYLNSSTFHVRAFEGLIAGILRNIIIVGLVLISLRITFGETRETNNYSWEPDLKVAKLFGGIFVTIISAIAILRAGEPVVTAPLLDSVTNTDASPNNPMYFGLTGSLASFFG